MLVNNIPIQNVSVILASDILYYGFLKLFIFTYIFLVLVFSLFCISFFYFI